MKAVFGDPLTGVNTEALVPMGAADRTISAKNKCFSRTGWKL